MSAHRHTWTLFYDHFGWYGDKDAHWHACFDCGAMLVGKTRECDRDRKTHKVSR
jgi:hypothetical protein